MHGVPPFFGSALQRSLQAAVWLTDEPADRVIEAWLRDRNAVVVCVGLARWHVSGGAFGTSTVLVTIDGRGYPILSRVTTA